MEERSLENGMKKTTAKARHLRTRRRKHGINQKRAYLGVNTSNKEAGIYIDLKINDVPAKCLVDTAATISLVSNEIFYALDTSKRPEVRPLRTNLSSIGQSLFNLKMGNQQCGIEAVIADLAIDGILGLDFVQRYNCLIDLRGNVLCFVNEELPLYIEGQIGSTTEMIVDGHVQCVSKLRTFSKSAFSQVCDKELVTHPMDPYDGEASMEIVRNWFSKNKRPPFHKVRNHGYVIKSLWSQWNDLRLKNGILYRVSKEDGALCVVIPFCEKRNIIQQSHADKTSAYLGVREKLARIKQKFYWPGIRKDVRSYVASCEPCSQRKCLLQKNRDLMKRQALGCPVRRCNSQKVFEKREQGRQPPEYSNIHKVMNGTTWNRGLLRL